MDEIKKELLEVFNDSPRFSAKAKATVCENTFAKSRFKWKTSAFAVVFVVLLLVMMAQWLPSTPANNTAAPADSWPTVPTNVSITTEAQYHITNDFLSMNLGQQQFVGDVVIDPSFKEISRGDVVYIQASPNYYVLARVIGLPGEIIELKDGQVFINREPLDNGFGKAQVDGYASYSQALQTQKYDPQKLELAFHADFSATKLLPHELYIITDDWLYDAYRGVIQTDTDIVGLALGMKAEQDEYVASPMSKYPATDDAQKFANKVMDLMAHENIAELETVLDASATMKNGLMTFHDHTKFHLLGKFRDASYLFAAYLPDEDLFEVGYRIEEENIAIYLQVKEQNGTYTLYNCMTY